MLRISSFFIYNSNLCEREGEEAKKLIFYHPKDEKLFRKVNDVGLCEAVVQFSKTFSSNSCDSMHTELHSYAIYQAEPQYWMVLVTKNHEKDGKSKVGEKVANFISQEVLKIWFNLFRILYGTFSHNLAEHGKEVLEQKTNAFFCERLLQMTEKLKNSVMFSSLHFVTLKQTALLNIQSMLRKCTGLEYSILMQKEQIAFSDLEIDESALFVYLLVHDIRPDSAILQIIGQGTQSNLRLFHGTCYKLSKSPLYIQTKGSTLEELDLLVYKVSQYSLFCFIKSGTPHKEICQKIDSNIGAYLLSIPSTPSHLAHRNSITNSVQTHFVFLKYQDQFLSSANVASLSDPGFTDSLPQVAGHKVFKTVADIRASNSFNRRSEAETVEKVQNDYWIATKKMDNKEAYAIIHHKNANLININDDVRRISSYFDTVFFSE